MLTFKPKSETKSKVKPIRKYRHLIKLVREDGWYLKRHNGGSHRQFKHPTKKGLLTIAGAGKANADVPAKTLNSVLKQAGLKR